MEKFLESKKAIVFLLDLKQRMDKFFLDELGMKPTEVECLDLVISESGTKAEVPPVALGTNFEGDEQPVNSDQRSGERRQFEGDEQGRLIRERLEFFQ